jgi:hypothetical protein
VVRSPERWLRIVAVAKDYGDILPTEPDSRALSAFLAKRRSIDPLRFPDLSLVIVKLMGAGEYVVESPRGEPIGHFGLAVRDYTHSTAPNRRYPDLITLRMVKAALTGERPPYADGDLAALALHCTRQEDAARKVERQLRKSEAALLLDFFTACGRQVVGRHARVGCGRQGARAARICERGARLYRLCAGGLSLHRHGQVRARVPNSAAAIIIAAASTMLQLNGLPATTISRAVDASGVM